MAVLLLTISHSQPHHPLCVPFCRAAGSRRVSPGISGPHPDDQFSFELRDEGGSTQCMFARLERLESHFFASIRLQAFVCFAFAQCRDDQIFLPSKQ